MSTSLTYRFLKKIGLNFSEEEYGNVTFWMLIKKLFIRVRNSFLLKYCMYSVILSPINYRLIRPKLWRMMGCKIGKDVFIGYEVLIDASNAHLIEVGDRAHITNRCLLLCHQRDLKNYYRGDDSAKLPYKKGKIIIGKGVMIGMDTIIMPGVTIGDGSIIGAGSMVTKDIPSWKIATGRPARVVKSIKEKEIL